MAHDSESVSFFNINYDGKNVAENIAGTDLRYTITNGIMKLFQNNKQVDDASLTKGNRVQVRADDNGRSSIVAVKESTDNDIDDDFGISKEEPVKDENAVCTMLPQVGLNNGTLTKQGEVDNDFIDEKIKKDVEDTPIELDPFSESVEAYMIDPSIKYTDKVEESVHDIVLNMKTKIEVSRKTRKCIIDIAILKTKIKIAEKKGTDKLTLIDMKKDLIRLQKELNTLEKSATPGQKIEIARIKKAAIKNTESDKVVKECVEITEAYEVSLEGRIRYWEKLISDTKEKIAKSTDKNDIKLLEKKINEYNQKVSDLKNPPKKSGVGLKGECRSSAFKRYATASTDVDTSIDDNDVVTEQEIFSKKAFKEYDAQDARLNPLRKEIVYLQDKFKEAKTKYDQTGDRIYETKMNGFKSKIEKAKKTLENTEKSVKANSKAIDRKNIVKEEIKDQKKKMDLGKALLYGESVIEEAANMEDEIKPLVEKLNQKGYKVKYASPGHYKLRRKEDREPDGVYNGSLYSDARIMFDQDYSLPNAPKCWKWRIVDGCKYLDVIPRKYNEKDGTPNEAFEKWKDEYMDSLKSFINSIDNETDDDKEDEVKESVDDMLHSLFDDILDSVGE